MGALPLCSHSLGSRYLAAFFGVAAHRSLEGLSLFPPSKRPVNPARFIFARVSTVDLSSINRAAMSAKEGYWWINGIAVALSLVIASMSWSAYDDIGQPERALVCIVAQALAIALAILGRRALTGQMPVSAIAAGVLAGGCAWWASHGLALAWYDDAERNGEPMVIFLAALEPALFLLAEHVKEGREALRAAHEKNERELADELAEIRRRSANAEPKRPASRPFQPKVVEGGRPASQISHVGQSVAGAVAVSATVAGVVADRPADAASFQPPPLEQVSHSQQTWASREAHAAALLKGGLSQRAVVRETGLSRYMVGQIAKVEAA